jgi:predicted phosphodiesterase
MSAGTSAILEVTTVADDLVVLHRGHEVIRLEGLTPDTEIDLSPYLRNSDDAAALGGTTVRTLPRPTGRLLCRVATVNDVHFGETECGRIDDNPQGPIQRAAPGEPPYPETMNRGAAAEIAAIGPDAVIVKGDLTVDGQPDEFAAFESCWRGTFGDRLHVVRGNHDAYKGQHVYHGDQWIELDGLRIALLDTVTAGITTGYLDDDQIEWLDTRLAESERHDPGVPVLAMGHHQQWLPGENGHRSDDYFGIHPDPSDRLSEVAERRRALVAYTAGHTHRHRIRSMACGVPSIEIGCVKDFPGTWAEYRVFEGGILQVVHRISTPEALAWSERCRFLYSDFGIDYQSYALGELSHRCCVIPLR